MFLQTDQIPTGTTATQTNMRLQLWGGGGSSLQGYSEHAINTEGIAVAPQGEGHRKACEGRPHRRSAESDGSGAAREWKMIQPPSIQKEK